MNDDISYFNKDSKRIIVANGTKMIPDEAFMNYDNLEEIIIADSVEYIGKCAFKGCKSLKKVVLSNKLMMLDDLAFCECEKLEMIEIPKSLHYFSYGLFKDCINLKVLKTHDSINYIEDLAFYNCKKLSEFHIPNKVTSIGHMAFYGCDSIKKIHIPSELSFIEVGAFAMMSSLEEISIDSGNQKYLTVDNDTVLISKDGMIIQYAINCNCEEFVAGYYTESYGNTILDNEEEIPLEVDSLIYNIADYAFAGAKKLKKFIVSSELESIGSNTFLECENLRDLEIFCSKFGKNFILHIHNDFDKNAYIPFENIIIGWGVCNLCGNLSEIFKNARNVILPDSIEHIGENVFSKSQFLNFLKIPKAIKTIFPNTFYSNINLEFFSCGIIKARDFNMLQTKTSENYYIENNDRDNIRILSMVNGTYFVKINDFDTIRISREEINKLSNSSKVMVDTPDEIVNHLIDLLSINSEFDRLLVNIWSDDKLKNTFFSFVNDCDFVNEIASKKIAKAIRKIINNAGIYDEFLFTGMLMKKLNKEEIIKVSSNYSDSINRFFRFATNYEEFTLNVDKLIRFCSLLEKYQKYDKFLYNPIFFMRVSDRNQELLVRFFDKNLKRLLINSQTLNDNYGEDLNDLLNLCNSLGVFCDDEKIRQKTSTFISEKLFCTDNDICIVGNNIHTIFSDLSPREEVDYEFILFFITNFKDLVKLEKENSGIIARIYNVFREISKTSTSHRGIQRHLIVTLDKCLDFFLAERFDGITEKNKDLANFLKNYYTESYALKVAEMICKQSQNAPRNIFTKFEYDKNGKLICSYDSKEDLFEENDNDFSFVWLPKQDYRNLILGKLCNCCAHLLGAGAGIMRASMILDNCQNLVIENEEKEIIAKMTIYVNKAQGYAVFNTAEININYLSQENLNKIYYAFMRGTRAFVDKYNENNNIKISTVSIGEYRNKLKYYFENNNTQLFETPNYSDYSFYADNKIVGTYNGDSKNQQLLVLKK